MTLPPAPMNVDDAAAAGGEPHQQHSEDEQQHQHQISSMEDTGRSLAPGVVSLFIGLGPAARSVRLEELEKFLKDNAADRANVLEVRLRGRCAFADIANDEEAQHLIHKLNGVMFEDRVRLTVQVSLNKKDERPNVRRQREISSRSEGSQVLFIGLGPTGATITDDQILQCLQSVCPVKMVRRKEQCAFVEVESREHATQLIERMNNVHIHEARLSVQLSRESQSQGGRKRGRHDSRDRHPYGDRRGGDRRGGELSHRRDGGNRYRDGPPRGGALRDRRRSSRSRSDSRDRRRGDRSRRSRYSDDSRDRRDRRGDRRDRRSRRSRSYSSRSYSSRSYSSRSRSPSDRRRRTDRRAPPPPRR